MNKEMEDNKLTLNSFCQLSENHRTQYTWIYGNLLTTKTESDYSYHLYLVDGFYVELVFDRATQQIQSIDPLLKSELLLKYLEDISLEALF
jgi:hypothetical protein